MNNQYGFSFLPVQNVQSNYGLFKKEHPTYWASSLQEALRACNEGFRFLATQKTFPPVSENYVTNFMAVLYDANHKIMGAYIPSTAEMERVDGGDIKGVWIRYEQHPKCPYGGFYSEVTSALHACDMTFIQKFNFQQPKLFQLQDDAGRALTFEHYGATKFQPEKVHAGNEGNLKPSGFWACAQGEATNWYSFSAHDCTIRHDDKIIFSLRDTAKILHIQKVDDIGYLQKHYGTAWNTTMSEWYPEGFYDYDRLARIMIDWEAVSKDYDGIVWSHNKLGNVFGPYDMNSICIFNPDMVIEHEQPNVLQFPVQDAKKIKQDVLDILRYQGFLASDEDYYQALSEAADNIALTTSDNARIIYYTALSTAAQDSVTALQQGATVPLQDQSVIESLNALAGDVRDEVSHEER